MKQIINATIKYGVSLLTVLGAVGMSAAKEVPSMNMVEEELAIFSSGHPPFGSNRVSIQMNGKIRIAVSDTINEEDFSGAGSFTNRLYSDDVKMAKQIHRLLCDNEGHRAAATRPRFPSAIFYSVACSTGQGQVSYRGSIDDLPDELKSEARDFFLRVSKTYVNGSQADVKLDIAVESIVRQNSRFLVSVKLINSGDYAIEIPSPQRDSLGEGRTLLSIQGKATDESTSWDAGLFASLVVNAAESGSDIVTIPARRSVSFQFSVPPDGKLKAGTYVFNAQAVIDVISRDFPANSLGLVDFHSDYKNPTTITLDRDYPSTPEEWKDYESRKAITVSPVPPGASISEPGYYRAASGFGTSALLKSFKADEQAPDAPADIQFAKWHWVADLARAVTCSPGEACPREGRWLLCSRGRYYGNPDLTHPQYRQRMRAGEVAPVLSIADVKDRDLYWTWQGA